MKCFLAGCAFWSIVAAALYTLRPGAVLNRQRAVAANRKTLTLIAVVAVITVLLCTLPMCLAPLWNGEMASHRNQYEVMAESLLDGRIDLDYGDTDPRLLAMDNPYDPVARQAAKVSVHWDHAFYNGKYYMYFGVVPVFLLFLPFRVLTGTSLTTYHATQIFTALFILGVFALFYLLAKKFFQKMSLSVYLSLSVAVSVMSVWYLAKTPALYCTAIAAGICMEIWSLYFFSRAVWDSGTERRFLLSAVLGSLFGALAFGCRPPVALANILAIPLFLQYIKGKKFDRKLRKQLAAIFAPYIVIGALLMLYNYARFENPFEFGQTYQLTLADQSGYGSLLSQFDALKIFNGLRENFFANTPLTASFPYLSQQSVFFNFPVCFAAALCLLQRESLSLVKKNRLTGMTALLVFCPILITVAQILASPFLIERYRSDIYWIIGILLFFCFAHFLETLGDRPRAIGGFVVSLFSFTTVFRGFLLWTVPYDYNFTEMFPETLTLFDRVLCLKL